MRGDALGAAPAGLASDEDATIHQIAYANSSLSGLPVHFDFHVPDAFDQGIEFRRVIPNDAGGA
ncbi:MAG: hypothetical protein OXE53_09720, partial [Deltaproteobacteria bacterium]|nr:hypothetical protein [Deltaproteobacteria bacterium]